MQHNKPQQANQFPQQLSRDEFIAWWNEINPETAPDPAQGRSPSDVIYLGQDPLEEA